MESCPAAPLRQLGRWIVLYVRGAGAVRDREEWNSAPPPTPHLRPSSSRRVCSRVTELSIADDPPRTRRQVSVPCFRSKYRRASAVRTAYTEIIVCLSSNPLRFEDPTDRVPCAGPEVNAIQRKQLVTGFLAPLADVRETSSRYVGGKSFTSDFVSRQ
jgi:hypothetical protein